MWILQRLRQRPRLLSLIAAVAVLAVLLVGLATPAAAQPADPSPASRPPAAPSADPADPAGQGPQPPPGFPSPSGVIGGLVAQLGAQIHEVINSWFRNMVANALNPTLDLLSRSLLATPDLTADGGRAQDLWWTSMLLANTAYVLLVVIGGAVVMSHETLQTRYALKDVAPRLVFGLLAANTSLLVTGWGIEVANALSGAFLTEDIDPGWVAKVLDDLAIGVLGPGRVFMVFLAAVVLVLALTLVATYIARVAITILLIVVAPLALACHALPQTEGVARMWWRAFTACLAVQVGQALTLITVIQVFLTPDPTISVFGLPEMDLVGLLVTACLLWVLLRIPVWATRIVFTPRSSTVLRLAKTVVLSRVVGHIPGRP